MKQYEPANAAAVGLSLAWQRHFYYAPIQAVEFEGGVFRLRRWFQQGAITPNGLRYFYYTESVGTDPILFSLEGNDCAMELEIPCPWLTVTKEQAEQQAAEYKAGHAREQTLKYFLSHIFGRESR